MSIVKKIQVPFEIVNIVKETRGQLETLLKVSSMVPADEPVVVLPCDSKITLAGSTVNDILYNDGAITTYPLDGSRWSFVKDDEEGNVLRLLKR